MTNKTKNNNLDYLINPTFKVNRLLFQSIMYQMFKSNTFMC